MGHGVIAYRTHTRGGICSSFLFGYFFIYCLLVQKLRILRSDPAGEVLPESDLWDPLR